MNFFNLKELCNFLDVFLIAMWCTNNKGLVGPCYANLGAEALVVYKLVAKWA